MAEEKSKCGLIMPISPIDDCSKEHWSEVQDILSQAIDDAGLEPRIVSSGDEVGVIQKRIVQNLYEDPIVVCDVSGKNPNVMFELGLRLAFDKPTIIVKDDRTNYSFDTAPIEHLEYPRDLRFTAITEFKRRLTDKVRATIGKSADHSFLKSFGTFQVAKLDAKEVPAQEIILEELRSLRTSVRRIESQYRPKVAQKVTGEFDVCLGHGGGYDPSSAVEVASLLPHVESVEVRELGPGHFHIFARLEPDRSVDQSAYSRLIYDAAKRRGSSESSTRKSLAPG